MSSATTPHRDDLALYARPSPPESVTETLQVPENVSEKRPEEPKGIEAVKKGRDFWLSFAAMIVSIFLSALDLTSVGTALPTIAEALNDEEGNYVWVGSAYALSSTAVMPLSGSLSDAFGRKPVMLVSIALFALGSALAGAAQNMNMMIGARTVQGLGGGGIINLVEILISDLVALSERGTYQGMIGLTWSFASAIAPPIGGALSSKGKKAWRWLFYLNLPLTGGAFILVLFFLNVRTPPGTVKEKLNKVDWFGNVIVICGTTLAIIGLTWGGIRYSWTDKHVLAPLIIGFALLVAFAWYEVKVPAKPTIPSDLLKNRTTLSAILMTAMHGITSISILYYLPVFFQSAFAASPIRSAVQFLPSALIIAPFALSSGFIVAITGKYRPVNWVGWALTMIGFGLLSLLKEDTSTGKWVGYQLVASAGSGLVFSAPVFPLLAPQPISRTASALALFAFTRAFTQTWGITIGSTILQNKLKINLPAAYLATFPPGREIAYAAIPHIPSLAEPLQTEVRVAFAASMKVVWQTMVGIAGAGFLFSLLMREVEMVGVVDETYALQAPPEKKTANRDIEKAAPSATS
ncbi:major facilitator superfamily domain-containing protein [Armillaria novae-zelandiae]|uniref:Major facilitator superfamily domain-containing protein n=1 Tax=Armillaria novae-zelandiae TaxID=153914 RepID=A0AA39PEF6_9AGAR|nr:major facilitator superfamily domain-containing protein [Armillaria novae-zelandiae]